MLRDDFDLRLTNELIETYLKIAYGIKPGCWLDAEKGLLQENTLYPKLKQMINDGNINDAEDILYEYANPINPDILKVGLFFYYDLNRMADAELEAADFTRDEVKKAYRNYLKSTIRKTLEQFFVRNLILSGLIYVLHAAKCRKLIINPAFLTCAFCTRAV